MGTREVQRWSSQGGFLGYRGSLCWTLKNKQGFVGTGCSREREQHRQSCVSVACSRTVREEGHCRKGCSEKMGLCHDGKGTQGLRGGVTKVPPWLWGGKRGVCRVVAVLPDSSSGCVVTEVWLEEEVWSPRGIPPGRRGG